MKVKVNKKKIAIVLFIIFTVFICSNAFAALVGAPNIFFAIKNMVVQEEVKGEDELLLDRDITISYSPIKIKNGLELQVNRILIEEGKSKLFITLENKNNDDEQLGINVYNLLEHNNTKDVLSEDKFLIKSGMKKSFEIEMDTKVAIDSRLSLEIIIGGKAVGKNIIVDLALKEIVIEGTEPVKKISEVELKRYLGHFSMLNHKGLKINDRLIYIADAMNSDMFDEKTEYFYPRKLMVDIIDSFYADPYFTENVNGVEILKANEDQFYYDQETDTYKPITDGCEIPKGVCLGIEDISYKSGIYTVDYIYILSPAMQIEEKGIENLTQYKATIELELNSDSDYSKYRVISLSDPIIVKESEKVIYKDIENSETEDDELEINYEDAEVEIGAEKENADLGIGDETVNTDLGNNNKTDDVDLEISNENMDLDFDLDVEDEKIEEPSKPTVEFGTITSYNYGDKVNYSVTVNGVVLDDWRLFYNDREQKHVYMIYDGYLDNSVIDLSEQGMVNKDDKVASLKDADESRDILYTNLTQTAFWYDLLNDGFKSTAKATSMGAPTLDIFVKSWNEKGNKKLYTKQEDMGIDWGLTVGDTPNPAISTVFLGTELAYYDNLYFPHREQNVGGALGYWLSTPAVSGQNAMMAVENNGIINFVATSFPAAYRPVIMFESDVKGYRNEDGSWTIDYWNNLNN